MKKITAGCGTLFPTRSTPSRSFCRNVFGVLTVSATDTTHLCSLMSQTPLRERQSKIELFCVWLHLQQIYSGVSLEVSIGLARSGGSAISLGGDERNLASARWHLAGARLEPCGERRENNVGTATSI